MNIYDAKELKGTFKMLEARAAYVKIAAAEVYGRNSEYAQSEFTGFTEQGATFLYEITPARWGGSAEEGTFVISWETMALTDDELTAHFTREKQEEEERLRRAKEEAERRCSKQLEDHERAELARLKAKYETEVK